MTAGNAQVAERLKAAREALHMTQPAFAAKCGVSMRAYQDYEAGKRLPGPDVLQAAVGLGIDVNWLLSGVGTPPSGGSSVAETEPVMVIEADRAWWDDIRARIGDEPCPIPLRRLVERPDLDAIRQDLLKAVQDPTTPDERKASADLFLDIAFGDRAAAERSEGRLLDVGQKLRNARALIDDAADAAGWRPPPAVWHALHTITFRYHVAAEDLVLLLDAMRAEFPNDPERRS
ncbi:MAG: helix-turn-helix transcriptional regulator [Pseudomonadota bacterium]